MAETKQLTIEETFQELDQIINIMEKRDTPLEEAFDAYEKGMKLVRECNASLDLVEKRIEEIQLSHPNRITEGE